MAFAVLALSAKAQLLGPVDPIQTANGNDWYTGQNGATYCSVTDTNAINIPGLPDTGIYATNYVYGTNVFYFSPPQFEGCDSNSAAEGTSSTNQCDFRALAFPLNGATTVEISFYYYAPSVKSGDNVRVDLRMFNGNNFVSDENQHPFSAGTMSGWQYYQSGPITVPANANNCDIDVSINKFGDDNWSSGAAYFEDFLVAVTPQAGDVLGPVETIQTANGYDWYTGHSGASYNSVVDTNAISVPGLPANGIYATNILFGPAQYDAYDSNSVSTAGQTGENNCDFRAASFPLNGAQTVDFSFYYYSPNVNSGDQVRVDLRMYEGPNDQDFVADENQHPFSGGTMSGWAFYDSGPITVPSGANDADIDVSINDFGDGIWSSGAAYFDDFLVTVYSEPPVITQQPVSAIVNVNASFTNTVVAGGPPPLSYQWYENGAPVTDAVDNGTNSTLVISSVQTSDNSADYYVVITNVYGATTSSVVSLTVNTNLAIIRDIYPTNLTVFAGARPTLSIALLAASGAPEYGFQWYSNNIAIGGATGASYTLPGGLSAGYTATYYCAVTNAYATLDSSVASVTFVAAPTAPYPLAVLALHPIGYWRLNEPDCCGGPPNGGPNNGAICHDYVGGNNGIYTNVLLGNPGYSPATDPTETSAYFGDDPDGGSDFGDQDANSIPGINFGSPSGTSVAFTVEAWVNGYAQSYDAGIVTLGWGGGGEQFNMDTGANDPNHDFRFFMRDASGNVHGVSSTNSPLFGTWYHLVAVVDEISNQDVAFYINGQLVGTDSLPSGSGVLSSTNLMSIGARLGAENTNYNFQFEGDMNDVAVFNYALSPSQIVNEYQAAGVAATVVVSPTNTVISANGTATFSATVIGTPSLTNQWYQNGVPINGATSTTLVLSDVPAGYNEYSYYLATTNAYGGSQSQPATLTVISGLPQISIEPPSLDAVVQGIALQLSATVYGTLPIGYQWQYSPTNVVNWTSIANSAGVTGAQSNVLTIANVPLSSAGLYQLVITNSYGAVTSSVAQVTLLNNPIGFNGAGAGWTGNQSGNYSTPIVANGLLTLSDGVNGEDRSFWFNYPQYIGAFRASFTYQDVGGGGADGMSFCLQNQGTNVIGGGGGGMSYSGITPSAALLMNIYSGDVGGVGYCFATNGDVPSDTLGLSFEPPGSVNIASGDPINVTLNYDGTALNMTLVDSVADTSFSATLFTGNLADAVGGNTAYVGFTGATGGVNSTQTITNFTFVSLATEAIQVSGTNALISWSQLTPGYTLQVSTNLAGANWANVTNAVQNVNGQNQVVVPAGSRSQFYRLVLP